MNKVYSGYLDERKQENKKQKSECKFERFVLASKNDKSIKMTNSLAQSLRIKANIYKFYN